MSESATIPAPSTAGLWCSAVLLALLCGLLLGRGSVGTGVDAIDPASLLGAAQARAGMVSHVGSLAVMTCDVGTEEVLVVLDNRGEQMLVYRVENMNTASLVQRVSLPRVFLDGRHRAQGRPPP
jgi:hypothetical protein